MTEDTTKTFSEFEARVLNELSAISAGQVEIRREQAGIREEQAEMRLELAEMRREISALGSRVNSIEERLTSVEARLTSLEDRVDARLRETRPIWEAVLEEIRHLDSKFDEVLRDLFDVRADVRRHDKRLLQLEKTR